VLLNVVIFFENDNFQLLADGLWNLLEGERHRFVLVRADVLVELLVDLVDDAAAPGLDLFIHQLDFVVDCLDLVLLTGLLDDVQVQFVQVWVLCAASLLYVGDPAGFELQVV